MGDIVSGRVAGDILVNTTSLGMHPHEDASPVVVVRNSTLLEFPLTCEWTSQSL